MAHPLLEKAAQHTAQARAINDEFKGKDMPGEAARQMQSHLAKATDYRQRVTREAQLKDTESWLSEPDYKHDMGASGESIAGDMGHGEILLEGEKKEREQKAFFDFIRKGREAVEHKGALVEDATGQVLVPQDYVGTIVKDISREGVIRGLATVRPTSRNKIDIGSLLVGDPTWGKLETGDAAGDGLGDPPADSESINVHNLNALVLLGVDELDDTDDNLESIIRQELGAKFGEAEDDAFAGGTGDAAKRPWGIAERLTQTIASAVGEALVADDLKRLKYRVPAAARRNGVYLAHSSAEEQATLLKDGNDRYLWQPSVREGEPATFSGHRWYTVDGLPAVDATVEGTGTGAGAGANPSVVFGDVRRGYLVADRKRLTVQRLVEKYAEEGKIGLLFTHRVGGDVIRPKALAGLLL